MRFVCLNVKIYHDEGGRFRFRCRQTAKDKSLLRRLSVTHVLNAAEGTWNNVDTGAAYYADMEVVYYGVVAEDVTTFDLSPHFYPAAMFIREALSCPESKRQLLSITKPGVLTILQHASYLQKTSNYFKMH